MTRNQQKAFSKRAMIWRKPHIYTNAYNPYSSRITCYPGFNPQPNPVSPKSPNLITLTYRLHSCSTNRESATHCRVRCCIPHTRRWNPLFPTTCRAPECLSPRSLPLQLTSLSAVPFPPKDRCSLPLVLFPSPLQYALVESDYF